MLNIDNYGQPLASMLSMLYIVSVANMNLTSEVAAGMANCLEACSTTTYSYSLSYAAISDINFETVLTVKNISDIETQHIKGFELFHRLKGKHHTSNSSSIQDS